MIAKALYDYLTTPSDLTTGQSVVPFVSPQSVIGGLICRTRNDARRYLLERVGLRFYHARRPADVAGHTAVTFRTITAFREYSFFGEQPDCRTLLQVDAWTRHGDAGQRAQIVGELIRLACSGWYEELWGDTYVYECKVERDGMLIIAPSDATDDWTHQYSIDLSIAHQQAAAYYPAIPLAAHFDWVDEPQYGLTLRLDASESLVPEERTIANIAWVVKIGGESGTTVAAFNGAPTDPPSPSGITGTVAAPEVSRQVFGLDGQLVHVTVTITDSDGTIDSYKDERYE